MSLLHRQVHPDLVRDGRPAISAFKPHRDHEGQLSVTCGLKLDAKAAYQLHVSLKNKKGNNLASAGTATVTRDECALQKLPVNDAATEDNPAHCHVSFAGLTKADTEVQASALQAFAITRDWTYRP